MIIQLNINLGLHSRNFNQVELKQRFEIVDYLVRNNTDWEVQESRSWQRQVEHATQDLLVLENVYVARLYGYASGDDGFISSLADVLGQGCIAVWNESNGIGRLIGSHTDPWGEFDSSRFLFIEEIPA